LTKCVDGILTIAHCQAWIGFAEAADSEKNSRNTPFDFSTVPVVKIADLGNACWTVSIGFSLML